MFFFGVENEVLNLALFARFDVTSIISTNIAARLLVKEYGICERVRLGYMQKVKQLSVCQTHLWEKVHSHI